MISFGTNCGTIEYLQDTATAPTAGRPEIENSTILVLIMAPRNISSPP